MHSWFLAIPLPPKLKKRLAEEADRLRLAGAAVVWGKPDHYHVSLRVLGEMPDEAQLQLLPLIEESLVQTGPLRLVVRGIHAFPDGEKPRIILMPVIGAEDSDEEGLLLIQSQLNEGLSEQGFRRHKHAPHPHVPLGRLRGQENFADLLERMGPARNREFGHFEATSVGLFESGDHRAGPEFHLLRSFAL
jgi:2'-5' RNA ligase